MNNDSATFWALGQKIRPIDTGDPYRMVEITSPPQVPGLPPHFHKNENELLVILDGTLDVMRNGDWQRFSAGSYVGLPSKATHRFVNNPEQDAVWVTGGRPNGFQTFFQAFGTAARESHALERLGAEEPVQTRVQNVERYGMPLSD